MLFKELLAQVVFIFIISNSNACIKLLNSNWQPVSLKTRTANADLVVTGRILYKTPIPGQLLFYSATFEVLNVLKGWDVLKSLHQENSKSIVSLDPKLIVSANGFGDSRLCFSNVEVGESYALFLGYRKDVHELVAKYDDIFGAADLLYKRTEREILQSLGWKEWSSWSKCDKYCGTGTQERKRECHKMMDTICTGPHRQTRQCNTYACSDSINILPFVLGYQDSGEQLPWKPLGETFDNQLEEKSASKAPTHLLLSEEFPRNSVLHIAFHGPVKDPQFIYSIYNAKHQMKLGIKVSPYSVDIVYDKPRDFGRNIRRSRSFPYLFTDDAWYSLAVLFNKNELKVNINCAQTEATYLEDDIFKDFDIFGNMYIGADKSTGKQGKVSVEIGQITLVKDPNSIDKQCGNLQDDAVLPKLNKETTLEPTLASGDGPLSGPDDSESGDVDEDYGSGQIQDVEADTNIDTAVVECDCKNGGVCNDDGTCKCPNSYTGKICEKPVCKNKCLNGGKCVKPNQCECKKGTSGEYCQFMECQLPCKNGGMCVGPNQCQCPEGFEGPQCQNEKCTAKCENGGTCTEKIKCRCQVGYKGNKCQYKETCKSYVTKLVSHLKPALVYKYIYVLEPCEDNAQKKCKKKKLKKETVNRIDYRPEYVCKR